MTAVIPDITQQTVFNALAAFITSVVDCAVLKSQVNRVAMPTGDVIYITPLRKQPFATNVDTYTDPNVLIQRSTQFDFQVDCYGVQSADRAQTLCTLLRDDYAFQKMAAGVKPLYATEAHQMPLITGEEQYLERWTFEAALQASPTLTLSQDFMESADIGLIDVDVKYPPVNP